MLKEDIAKIMTCDEYGGFITWARDRSKLTVITDRDFARVDYLEHDVHEFLNYVRGVTPENEVPGGSDAG